MFKVTIVGDLIIILVAVMWCCCIVCIESTPINTTTVRLKIFL